LATANLLSAFLKIINFVGNIIHQKGAQLGQFDSEENSMSSSWVSFQQISMKAQLVHLATP